MHRDLVENRKQALDKLEDLDNKFSLVLLDLLMPDLSGKGVVETIMHDERLCEIPAIVMNSRDGKQHQHKVFGNWRLNFCRQALRIQSDAGSPAFPSPRRRVQDNKARANTRPWQHSAEQQPVAELWPKWRNGTFLWRQNGLTLWPKRQRKRICWMRDSFYEGN